MRVLVTRPEPDGQRTAAALLARGHEPLLARLTTVIPCDPPMKPGYFEAILATSAHALEALPQAWRAKLVPMAPLFVVGERTAEVARAAGFERVIVGPGDALGLLSVLLSHLGPRSHVLYLAGEPRKPLMEEQLMAANHAVKVVLVYRAVPLAAPPAVLIEALGSGPLAVLHFSRASAESFANLASAAGLEHAARQCWHACLSADVATGLAQLAPARVAIAVQPNELALLAALDRALAQNSPQGRFEGDDITLSR